MSNNTFIMQAEQTPSTTEAPQSTNIFAMAFTSRGHTTRPGSLGPTHKNIGSTRDGTTGISPKA
jgi:hypothetical protein